MDAIINLLDPWFVVSLIVTSFWLWITWANLNSRVKSLETKMEKLDITKIETTLAEIQTDLKWIMKEMRLEK